MNSIRMSGSQQDFMMYKNSLVKPQKIPPTQWHTQEFCLGGGSTNSFEDRENGDLGAGAP